MIFHEKLQFYEHLYPESGVIKAVYLH